MGAAAGSGVACRIADQLCHSERRSPTPLTNPGPRKALRPGMRLCTALARRVRGSRFPQAPTVGTLGYGSAFPRDLGQRSIWDASQPISQCLLRATSGLGSGRLPLCSQLVTRCPLMHASHAYFSPSMSMMDSLPAGGESEAVQEVETVGMPALRGTIRAQDVQVC